MLLATPSRVGIVLGSTGGKHFANNRFEQVISEDGTRALGESGIVTLSLDTPRPKQSCSELRASGFVSVPATRPPPSIGSRKFVAPTSTPSGLKRLRRKRWKSSALRTAHHLSGSF